MMFGYMLQNPDSSCLTGVFYSHVTRPGKSGSGMASPRWHWDPEFFFLPALPHVAYGFHPWSQMASSPLGTISQTEQRRIRPRKKLYLTGLCPSLSGKLYFSQKSHMGNFYLNLIGQNYVIGSLQEQGTQEIGNFASPSKSRLVLVHKRGEGVLVNHKQGVVYTENV